MKTAYIIDGNSEVCRAFYSPGSELRAPTGEPTKATFSFVRSLLRLIREKQPDYLVMVTDPPRANTLRRQYYPEYKANREKKPPEFRTQLKRCKQIAAALGVACTRSEVHEADDVIATLTRIFHKRGHEVVIVSRDKDLMQLLRSDISMFDPLNQWLLAPLHVETKFGVSPKRLRDYLSLVGDTGDNIPGVPGVGPVTAQQWLRSLPDGVKGLLEHPEQASTGMLKFLERKDGWRKLKLSWRLVGLRYNADFDPRVLKRFRGVDMAGPVEIFRELGFHHLLGFNEAKPRDPLFARGG